LSLTIDASVLVAAAMRDEPAHRASAEAMRLVAASGEPVHQPALTVVEVTAAAARRTGDTMFARRMGQELLAMPGLVVHELDADAALHAAALAGELRVRAADAIYAATALLCGAVLVTLDAEVVERGGAALTVMTPAAWLAGRAAPDPASSAGLAPAPAASDQARRVMR
jgi:predicted nucleic acid-binding protein